MRAPLDRIDVVAVRDDHFADRIVVLQSDLNFNGTLLVSPAEDDRRVQNGLGTIQINNKLAQAFRREELDVLGARRFARRSGGSGCPC